MKYVKFKLKLVKFKLIFVKFIIKIVNFKLKCVNFEFKIWKFQIKLIKFYMKKYKLQLTLIGCDTHKLYESTNMENIFWFRTDEKVRSCHFIPNKMLSLDACVQWNFKIKIILISIKIHSILNMNGYTITYIIIIFYIDQYFHINLSNVLYIDIHVLCIHILFFVKYLGKYIIIHT